MKTLKVALGVVGALVCLLVVSQRAVSAQDDPFIGTWKLNVAKSTFSPGPAPRSQTSIYEAAGQGVKVTTTGVNAEGKPINQLYTANYDGKDYAVTGNADYDMTILKRVDPNTVEFTRTKAGKVVQTGTNVVSKDGKMRTVTTKGTNSKGETINSVAVYEKQ